MKQDSTEKEKEPLSVWGIGVLITVKNFKVQKHLDLLRSGTAQRALLFSSQQVILDIKFLYRM